jgi:outer membrane protein OmpA-like peptidoglycan-associated protein
MKTISKIGILIAGLLMLAGFALAMESDVPESKDPPLFTRMPNFYISDYKYYDFDAHTFVNSKGEDVNVEGQRYYVQYRIQEGARPPSQLQIIRNYTNAIKKLGGTVEKENVEGYAYMKLQKDNTEIWVHIETSVLTDINPYQLNIIQKGEMIQDVVANPEVSEVFAKEIDEKGKVVIYGIHFDTDKSEVKPESEAALKEVSKLLSQNSSLKLYIVGHTDNVGELDYNMKLSQARAESVIKELTSKYGVALDRVKPYGVGPLSPVASNKTEEGRAKNRRVELIEQ